MKILSPKRHLCLLAAIIVMCSALSIGGTIAWFTDEVTSGENVITSGNLDVEMDWAQGTADPAASNIWRDASSGAIFNHDRWEPGYVEARHIRIRNAGSLALYYQLFITPTGAAGILADVIDVHFVAPAQQVSRASLTASNRVGTLREVIDGEVTVGAGMLLADEGSTATIALKMQESAGNEYMNQAIGTDFSVYMMASQAPFETDAFDSSYDAAAFADLTHHFTASISVAGKVDSSRKTTEKLTIGTVGSGMSAEIPAGVKLAPGANELVMDVSLAERNENIRLADDQVSLTFDVHIEGIAADNTKPMVIHLGKALPAGLKDTSVKLYHVENGSPKEMAMADPFTRHNQFTYDSATGAVSIYIASFSEITAVVSVTNPWNGGVDIQWYNDTQTEFQIGTAEELAGLGALVADGNDFAGKTIYLTNDLDLGGADHKDENGNALVFYPMGYRYVPNDADDTAHPFRGTFDGQGHRISDLYQNTWNIQGHYGNGYYNNSLGLFALVEGAAIRNLTLENFILEGEFAPAGCVAGMASGGTFENITLRRCKPATYNTGVGGLIGWDEGTNVRYIFDNITVGSSNTIIALWGSWDVACGGIMGYLDESNAASMKDCTVAACLDVYNDVCANYQYYQYRYAGMLVGTVGEDGNPQPNLTCSNCKVYLGDWRNYYYCEFEKNSSASYTEDFQFSRVDEQDIVFDLNGNVLTCIHTHTANEDRMAYHLPFSQLYTGYGWGANAQFKHPGVTVSDYIYDVIYLDGARVMDVEYITDNAGAHPLRAAQEGYNWIDAGGNVITSIPAGNKRSTVVYLNNKEVYWARFVDINGMVIHEEEFNPGVAELKYEPVVPVVTGYYGSWEPYDDRLKNAEADVIIRPVYTLEETPGFIESTTSLDELVRIIENGGTAVLAQDVTGEITGGNQEIMAVITESDTDKNADLVLNSFELSYDASSNANKNWTMFQIGNGCKMTVTGGLAGEGTLRFNINSLNSNGSAFIFDIKEGGTLVLERGVTIEINWSNTGMANQITPVNGVVDLEGKDESSGLPKYPGINIEKTDTSYKIIVTGTVTLVGNDPENK